MKQAFFDVSEQDFLIIGHRGAMGYAPENTLASFRKALELGVACVELDVYFVDGYLVVFHDERLERVSNGVGRISDKSFSELRELDVGGGMQIPVLQEVCDVLGSDVGINIELKGPGTALPVSRVISELLERGWEKNNFLVSSFNHRELSAFRSFMPDIKVGALLCGLLLDDARFAEDLGAFSVHQSLDFIDQRFIDDAHKRGMKVFVYTVNYQDDLKRMKDTGVDGVFTDFPQKIIAE